MNKKLIYLLALVFSLGLGFTACGDDDDDNPPANPDYAKEIAATYDGKLKIAQMEDIGELSNSIILSQVSENKAKVALNEIIIPLGENISATVKNISVNNIPVSKKDDIYTLAKTNEKIKVNLGDGQEDIDADVTVEGTVTGGKMNLTIKVVDVPVFPVLDITFEGTKK